MNSRAASKSSNGSTSRPASPNSNVPCAVVLGKLHKVATKLQLLAERNPKLAKAAIKGIDKLVDHLLVG